MEKGWGLLPAGAILDVRDSARALLSGEPDAARWVLLSSAVCRPTRSSVSRYRASELRVYAHHYRPRPRRGGQVLRGVRRSSGVRLHQGSRDHAAAFRGAVLLQAL